MIKLQTDKVLEEMANTFRDKDKVYGNNFDMAANIFVALLPNGIALKTKEDFAKFSLLNQKIHKLSRFMMTGMTHKDSIHDEAVYTAMLSDLTEQMNERETDE